MEYEHSPADPRPRDSQLTARGLEFHLRAWPAAGASPDAEPAVPFLLLHGLASNARTWDAFARILAAAGHPTFALDQRGHGLSAKPDAGYGFDEVGADLRAIVARLQVDAGIERPIIVGQSWGGNVVLDFAARYPDVPRGVVLVDGGYLELASRPGATWESISVALRPPPLAGTPRVDLAARIRRNHPDWTDEGIEGTLANFETRPDGTVSPWLTLDRHMAILRALWEHRPSALYARVAAPVLVAVAESGDADRLAAKRAGVTLAERSLARCRVRWFPGADHDIHVQRPADLAEFVLGALRDGLFES